MEVRTFPIDWIRPGGWVCGPRRGEPAASAAAARPPLSGSRGGKRTWLHGVSRACRAARVVSRRVSKAKVSISFTYLQDVGKAAMAANLHAEHDAAVRRHRHDQGTGGLPGAQSAVRYGCRETADAGVYRARGPRDAAGSDHAARATSTSRRRTAGTRCIRRSSTTSSVRSRHADRPRRRPIQYAHDSEFRYVLQPGEGIAGAHNLPIGQVFFVPREEITMRSAPRRKSRWCASRRPTSSARRRRIA